MSHSVSEQAARAVRNSQKTAAEKRTPEEILKGIRANRAAKLFVTPNDVDFLLAAYDAAILSKDQYQVSAETYLAALEISQAKLAELSTPETV